MKQTALTAAPIKQPATKTLNPTVRKPDLTNTLNTARTTAGALKERGTVALGISPTWNTVKTKRIAITFDDGPHPRLTERLLAILARQDVKATFFVVGKQAERYPELVQEIFQSGHELANHTYSHRDLRHLSLEEFDNEFDRTHNIVQSITDQQMHFFRPPGGQYDEHVVDRAKNLGYRMVLWNIFPGDHANPPVSKIKSRVLSAVQDGGIVLLHSGIENTLAALPELITELRNRGCIFVTLSNLLDNGDIELARRIDATTHFKP